MQKEYVGSTIRTLIIAIGGIAVGAGYIKAEELASLADNISAIVGAASIVAALVWSWVQKYQAAKKLGEALAPNAKEVPK